MIELTEHNREKIRNLLYDNEREIYLYREKNTYFLSENRQKSSPILIIPENRFASSSEFLKRFNLKYPYIAGAMAKGISSVKMAEELSKNGCMANFGSAGLTNGTILEKVDTLKSKCKNFGINIINIPGNQDNELELLKELIKKDVNTISAGAYIRMTPGLVYYRVKGIKKDSAGAVSVPNKILAKISRVEIARTFFSPPPEKIIKKLLKEKLITDEEAELSQFIPMSSDIIAEADSGGHTDKQPAISLFTEILCIKYEYQKKYPNIQLLTGLAGGISTPVSAFGAFAMGADFIVTGSVNQSSVESGTSEIVKEKLAKAGQSDFEMVPSADTFEMGGKVQVLKKGTKFSSRATFLGKIYSSYPSLEDLNKSDLEFIENKILKNTIEKEWETTKEFFSDKDIIENAEKNPKKKMALIFKSYLGKSSWWAINGESEREDDFQIWSGPSMSAFNSWVKGSHLENISNRKVADIALNILKGSIYLSRINLIQSLGINIPDQLKKVQPGKIL